MQDGPTRAQDDPNMDPRWSQDDDVVALLGCRYVAWGAKGLSLLLPWEFQWHVLMFKLFGNIESDAFV